MLGLLGARANGLEGFFGQSVVPLEVWSAVDTAPVPVGIHDTTNEIGVVDLRGVVAVLLAADIAWSSGCGASSCKNEELGESHDNGDLPLVGVVSE